jgi:hypothetical protein
MFGHTFYFSTIRKYVTLFGTLFNDIHITRTDANNNTVALLKVPLAYAPKEKVLARVDADPNIDRQTSVLLPRMSFEMIDMKYDSNRKLNTLGRTVVKDADSTSKLKYQYNPVPYNISFRLYVYVKNAEDGTKIIEQILPFFTPDWTTTVKLIPEMNIIMDIPVVLESLNIEDTYEGDFDQRRALIWTLDFTLKGYIYGPIKKSSVIKFANTNFYVPSVADGQLQSAVGVTDPSERITIRPGLTANGAPTSNVAESVSLSEIEADDDFGYCVSIDTIITE